MTETITNTRLGNNCLLIEKIINHVETVTLTDGDLVKKFIGIWDSSIEGKVFIVKNESHYQVISLRSMTAWPAWNDYTILKVLRKFGPNCEFFIFDTSEELIKWLAE